MIWFLRLFFNLLYHSFAWCYDLVAAVVSGGRWKDWVRSVIPLLQGEKVLELGIGTGTLQAALLAQGVRVYGVDESNQMLRIAKRRLGAEPNLSGLLRARAESLPLATHSVDSIVATFPSEFIFHPATLHCCRRVLRPGGQLVVLLGVKVGGSGLGSSLLRLLYRVTGQGAPDAGVMEQSLEGLKRYGFSAEIKSLVYRQDHLTIIIAV